MTKSRKAGTKDKSKKIKVNWEKGKWGEMAFKSSYHESTYPAQRDLAPDYWGNSEGFRSRYTKSAQVLSSEHQQTHKPSCLFY